MRRFFLFFMSLIALSVTADNRKSIVTNNDITTSDIETVFKSLGVQLQRFDLSALADKNYKISMYIDEYRKGKCVEERNLATLGTTKIDIPQNKEEREAFLAHTGAKVKKTQKKWAMDYLTVFTVIHGDSSAQITIKCPKGTLSRRVKLETLPGCDRPLYDFRVIDIDPITEKKQDIPLVIYNSYWYDEKNDVYRSCYARITRELDFEEFSLIPHCYIIGIVLEEREK